MNSTITKTEKCEKFLVDFVPNMDLVYKTFEIELHYASSQTIPKDNTFCKNCLVDLPAESRVIRKTIFPNIDCKKPTCETNLQVTSDQPTNTRFERGSSNTFNFKFKVENLGENSYATRIRVTIEGNVRFSHIPPTCVNNNKSGRNEMTCDLNPDRPLAKGETVYQSIGIDVLEAGESFTVLAHSTSVNQEVENEKNAMKIEVKMVDVSRVHVNG